MRDRPAPRTRLSHLAVTLAVLMAATLAGAQDDGVAGSGMHDGAGSITHHAEVELSMESLPGTGSARIAELGRAVGARMTAIRTCYNDVAEARPTVEGTMRVTVELGERGRPTVTVSEDGVHDSELVDCVRGAIAAFSTDDVGRPAGGAVLLTFRNTAAAGVAGVAAAGASGSDVAVSRSSGRPVASGEAREGALRLSVTGAADASDDLVREGYRVVASAIPGLLDCRRRAGRRGRDPAGDVSVTIVLTAGSAADATVVSSTVADTNAGSCVVEKLERATHTSAASGSVEATVTFGS